VVVTDENRRYLLSAARELENSQLCVSILSSMEGGLTVEIVCAIGGSDPGFFEQLKEKGIEFLASNFYALDRRTLYNVPFGLSSPSLSILP
jgi:hypothetical protein